MAISVFFRLMTQDEIQAQYAFADTSQNSERQLTVDKKTMRIWPTDGREDKIFDVAATRILVLLKQHGSWPERGGKQS